MTKEELKLATGHYMNYFHDYGGDLFIIINEPNGDATERLDVQKLYKADKICTEYLSEVGSNFNKKELEEKLEEVFEYGIQVISTRYIPTPNGLLER